VLKRNFPNLESWRGISDRASNLLNVFLEGLQKNRVFRNEFIAFPQINDIVLVEPEEGDPSLIITLSRENVKIPSSKKTLVFARNREVDFKNTAIIQTDDKPNLLRVDSNPASYIFTKYHLAFPVFDQENAQNMTLASIEVEGLGKPTTVQINDLVEHTGVKDGYKSLKATITHLYSRD